MATARDWCHFGARIERTSTHRRIKRGELGYEDEKFSYVVATPLACDPAPQRIVRHPIFHSGFVELQLCTTDGLRIEKVGKSRKQAYRAARKAAWGDSWQPQPPSEGNSDSA